MTAGGPIVTGKTFFFADYEGSLISSARTWVTTVPTAAQRNSGFTNYSDLISLQSGNVGTDILGRTFQRGTVFDPATTRQLAAGQVDPVTGMTATRAGFVRDSFAGNQIPAGRLSADAIRLMMLYPEPNVAGLNNNYVVNRQNTDDTHSFDTRVDHNFSTADCFFARYSFSNNNKLRPSPFDGDGDGGGFNEGDEAVRVHGLAASHTHMFSPTLINEARFGLSQEHTNRLQPNGDDTQRPAGPLRHPRHPAGRWQRRPAGAAAHGPDPARTRRLGGERALQQHGAVQRQPDEGVQVAHLQGRLHVPGHLLRLDPAALRPGRVLLGRPLHVAGQRHRQQHVARALRAVADPVAGPRRRRLPGRHARPPRLAVRRRGRLQDLPRRLRAGQLARLEQADAELRAALGLVQPRAGA